MIWIDWNKKERGDFIAVCIMLAMFVFGFMPPFFGIWRLIILIASVFY